MESIAIDDRKQVREEQNEQSLFCKEGVDVFDNFSDFDKHIVAKLE